MIEEHRQDGRFARLRARMAQTLLREPSVILLERDADALLRPRDQAVAQSQRSEAIG